LASVSEKKTFGMIFIYLFIYLLIKAKVHKGHLHRSKNY